MVPHGVYPCAGEDEWIAISAWTNESWKALAYTIGKLDWNKPEFTTIDRRLALREAINRDLAVETRRWNGRALMAALQAHGVAAALVRSAGDLIHEDDQLKSRGHWVYLDHPEMGRSLYDSPPFRISGIEHGPHSPAPLLGQHTDEVCREILGMTDGEIRGLKEDGVLS
jgi:benzylsuccinate CoA-transferase BbsF subunit